MAYNPDQPRVAAGEPGGGQWGGGGGAVSVKSMRGEGPRKALGPVTRATGPKLTEFDTPDVLTARYQNAIAKQTFLDKSPEREQLRDDVATRLYGDGAENKDREAWVVMGGPGSGKSTVSDEISAGSGSLEIDADLAKAELPEYDGGAGANAVHEESSEIAHRVLEKALVAGDNVVIQTVGRTQKNTEGMIGRLYAAGYKVHVAYIEVNSRTATQRARDRWRRPLATTGKYGRFVDPNYILNGVDGHPGRTFDSIKSHEGVYSWEHWDNNGASPRKLGGGPGRARRG